MQTDLTHGKITVNMLLFALPLMAGNLLQQLYNIADTWVVGHYIGTDALGAVGAAYALMTFLTSILSGLCMGSGAAISVRYGAGKKNAMRNCVFLSFMFIAVLAAVLNISVYLLGDSILSFLRVPTETRPLMQDYLVIVYAGIFATFLYNYFASVLRAVGNSTVPLIFLAVSAVLNVALDLLWVAVFPFGVKGAAFATVLSQFLSGIGILIYTLKRFPELVPKKAERTWHKENFRAVLDLSLMTSLQQSIMNFGILLVQGLVNSFGTTVMAAFAAAVKIDTFAYLPVQDFGNAFSVFVAQNHGADNRERIRKGVKSAVLVCAAFCIVISLGVCSFAEPLMKIFIDAKETAVIAVGAEYLKIEGAFYLGIGILFLLYGYFRAVEKPGISVILTVASLGTRVVLAYTLSAVPALGVRGIWMSVPIGWAFADLIGIILYRKTRKKA